LLKIYLSAERIRFLALSANLGEYFRKQRFKMAPGFNFLCSYYIMPK